MSTDDYTPEQPENFFMPETTAGGLAKSAGLGGAEGLLAYGDAAGTTLGGLAKVRNWIADKLPDVEPGGRFGVNLQQDVAPIMRMGAEIDERTGAAIRHAAEWARGGLEQAAGPGVGDTYAEGAVRRGAALGTAGLASLVMPGGGFSAMERIRRAAPLVTGAAAVGEGAERMAPDEWGPMAGLAGEAAGALAGKKALPLVARGARAAQGFVSDPKKSLHPLLEMVRDANKAFRAKAKMLSKDYDTLLGQNATLPTAPIRRSVQEAMSDDSLPWAELSGKAKRYIKEIMELPEEASYARVRGLQESLNRLYYPKQRLYPLRVIGDAINDGLDEIVDAVEGVPPGIVDVGASFAAQSAAKLRGTNRQFNEMMKNKRDFKLVKSLMKRFVRQNPIMTPGEFGKWIADHEDDLARQFDETHVENLYKIVPHVSDLPSELARSVGAKAFGSKDALKAYSSEASAAWVRAIGGILYKTRLLQRGISDVSGTIAASRSSLASLMSILDPETAARIAKELPEGGSSLGRLAVSGAATQRNLGSPPFVGSPDEDDPSQYFVEASP